MSSGANHAIQPKVTKTTVKSGQLIVGLTGGIGSGKTSIANAFAIRGADVIDTDIIARNLTTADGAAIAAIRSAFGDNMITQEGALDRGKMRALVFSDVDQKRRLESILHPMIRTEVARQIGNATGLYIIYVVPLLVETGLYDQQLLTRILVVDCDEELQIQRVAQRDGISEQLIKAIMAEQASREERRAIATDIICNQTTIEAIIPEIDRLHRLYCGLTTFTGKRF
ncbi:MAG: dephospho-CoA kinase [Solimicrobium sp.]|nr:dephospho-CoA kinase [Solimicrobium sp.]